MAAALGSNMGRKAPKKETPSTKQPKKKVAKVKANKKAQPKKEVAKKPQKKVVQSKKLVAKKQEPKTSKKVSISQSATSQKNTKPAGKKERTRLDLRNAKLILEPSKRKKIRKVKVILEGDLSINNVDAFMTQIEPIFDDFDYVDFFQREVTSLDLCHIQMLHHFQNHPFRKGKTVTINSDISPDLKKVVINAGFKELLFIPKLV